MSTQSQRSMSYDNFHYFVCYCCGNVEFMYNKNQRILRAIALLELFRPNVTQRDVIVCSKCVQSF